MPRVDLHTHILSGLDDGPVTAEESLAMARLAASDGTGIIVATPHYRDVELEHHSSPIVSELADTLNAALRSDTLRESTPPVRILTGMTHRLDMSLPDLVDSESAITLNRTRFLLVEPPFSRLPSYVEEVIGRLLTQRLVPVIAHPERNILFQQNPNRLQHLVDDGVIVQVASGSLTGQNGDNARRAAELYIRRGLAHVVSSEMHSERASRPPQLSEAFEKVVDLVGYPEAIDIFETNPDMILQGRTPQRERVAQSLFKRSWMRKPTIEMSNRIAERTQQSWKQTFRRAMRRTTRG